MRLKTLGQKPNPSRLSRHLASPNFKDGTFQNILPTPITRGGGFFLKTLVNFILSRRYAFPLKNVPTITTDLRAVEDAVPTVIWFGHSSYLIKYQGKNFLIDPVFSGYASPFSFMIRAFRGSNAYQAADMPFIDALIITHDHYDHLDYETVLALKGKFKKIYTPLGVGEHLEHWGFEKNQIQEFDWWDSATVSETCELTATPSRHFSGRSFERDHSLWASFVLKLGNYRIFIGGDSGYDSQFKVIGEKYGPFDLALLECGQYDADWPLIHMFPEQTAQAAMDLKAKVLLPVHWGKFSLSLHSWYDPIQRVIQASQELGLKIVTPRIGEAYAVGETKEFISWWEELIPTSQKKTKQIPAKGSALNSQS
ncbi:MBL fold metallo-hydrolase [Bdellovibrio sp. HCB2-146]|uniref:MBL fold metallo-hydrolase n=1 Tax=Bdellovibrio sp. HCB2-146 TaxID=3394362 RepID=UPI0039BD46C6